MSREAAEELRGIGTELRASRSYAVKITSHLNPLPMYIPISLLGMEFEEEYHKMGAGDVAPVHTEI